MLAFGHLTGKTGRFMFFTATLFVFYKSCKLGLSGNYHFKTLNLIVMRTISRPVILFLFVSTLFFTTCKKQDSPLHDQPITAKVNAWLNGQKSGTDENRNTSIQKLADKLDYTHLRFEELREGERFIVVPIKEGLETINNAGRHPVSALLLIENKSGTIRRGNIVQYIPAKVQPDAGIPVNSFFKIFNAGLPDEDAQFCFLTITGRLLYQVNYKDGRQYSTGVTQAGATIVNSPPQALISPAPVCTDWYLVTTYYYADGSTEQTEQYLYTTCEPGSGGGEANDIEYEFATVKPVNWNVARNPKGVTGEIKSFERIKGKRVPSEPLGGHFISIVHQGSECNFCATMEPSNIWIEEFNTVSIVSPHKATSYVAGMLNYDGDRYYPSNRQVWSFSEIDW
jgi:hypothetical protein